MRGQCYRSSTPVLSASQRRRHRKDLIDLLASGDDAGACANPSAFPRPVSRMRPPLMFGVFAQNAQIYTLGIVRLLMLMHLP